MKQFYAADYAVKYIATSQEYVRASAAGDEAGARMLLEKSEEILEAVHREGIHRQFQQEMKRRGH